MAFQGDSIFWVEVEKIVPNPFQPRREFDEDRLKELAESVRMYGVLQPLTVTRKEVYGDDGSFRTEYELIAGERRLRASQLAGLEQVPVIIRSGEQTEQEKLELAIIENLQREDLNAVDRALAFKQLADAFELSHSEVAKKVGRSREYVSNSIRLLALPENILQSLKRGEISEGHARTLLMLKDRPEEQDVVYREILLKKLSVREVERISRKIASDKVRKREWVNTDAHLIEMERAFTDTLGTRVQISKTDFGGKLTIDYFSEHDLEQILDAMKTRGDSWLQTPDIPQPAVTGDAPVVRQMDEVTAPLHEIVDATALELAVDANDRDHEALTEIIKRPAQPLVVTDAPAEMVPNEEPEPAVPTAGAPAEALEPEAPATTPESSNEIVESTEPTHEPPARTISSIHDQLRRAIPQFGAPAAAVPAPTTPTPAPQPPAPLAAPVPEVSETDPSTNAPSEQEEGQGDDLYSMKNFSL